MNEPAVDGRNDGVEADLLDGERDSDAGESTETVRGVVGDWRIAPSEAIVGVWKAGVMRDAGRGGRGVVGEVPGVGGRRVAGEDESWQRLRVYVRVFELAMLSGCARCSAGTAVRQANSMQSKRGTGLVSDGLRVKLA